jgi:hypothetical protein
MVGESFLDCACLCFDHYAESCFTPFDNLDTCLQAAYDGDLVTLKTFDERQVTHARACCFSSWNAVHMV